MSTEPAKIVLVTGCSSGIGKSLALQLASSKDKKYIVYASMRNPFGSKGLKLKEEAEGLEIFNASLFIRKLDVTKHEETDTLINEIMETHGKIDVVVNNAGVGCLGTHEMDSMEQVRSIFESNFFGIVKIHQVVLPIMRKQKSGHVIAVTSVGGTVGMPMNDVYCASKFAVEGYYEAMAAANKMCGISTSLIEPAATLTDFTSNAHVPDLETCPEELKEFANGFMAYVKKSYADTSSFQSSDDCAKVIVGAIEDGEKNECHLRYPTSEKAKAFVGSKFKDITGDEGVKGIMAMINAASE